MRLNIFLKSFFSHRDHREKNPVPFFGEQVTQVRLKDLHVEVESHRTESGCFEIFEKNGSHFEVSIRGELCHLIYLPRPLLEDLAKSRKILILFLRILLAEVVHDFSQADVQFFVGGSHGFKRADLKILFEERVVLVV
jgi:hypothetical protein